MKLFNSSKKSNPFVSNDFYNIIGHSGTTEKGYSETHGGPRVQKESLELVPVKKPGSKEDELNKDAMEVDFGKILYDILQTNFNSSEIERIHKLVKLFSQTFNDPNELKIVLGLLSDPKIRPNFGKLCYQQN